MFLLLLKDMFQIENVSIVYEVTHSAEQDQHLHIIRINVLFGIKGFFLILKHFVNLGNIQQGLKCRSI